MKSTIGFEKLSFSVSEILKFHFICSLQLPPRQFLTARLFLYPVPLYKHTASLLTGILRNAVNVMCAGRLMEELEKSVLF